jgi:hypothetical protein
MIASGDINKSVLSHRLRRRFAARAAPVVLSDYDLKLYVGDTKLPNPQEQADNLILWLGSTQRACGQWVQATLLQIAATVGSAIGPEGTHEPDLAWLMNQLKPSALYSVKGDAVPELQLTMAGWNLYEKLNRRVVVSRNAFMAMKFDDATMDLVLQDCFKAAAKRAGFELRPLNENQAAGLIDDQIRAAIRSSRFVIADLSHDSNGAYFEAGFAEGLGLPVIYTCEEQKFAEKKTHFDTNHMHTIPWNINRLDEAARALTATIRNTLPGEALMADE